MLLDAILLVGILGGIGLALWVLWAETITAWYEWRSEQEDEQ